MNIPVGNVYRLLIYAWDFVGAAPAVKVGGEEGNRLENLLGDALASGVETLLRRGLARDYRSSTVLVEGIRGKMDLEATLKALVHRHGRTWCTVSELDHDTPPNRAMKATMRGLLAVPTLDRSIVGRLRRCVGKLAAVADVRLTAGDVSRIQVHANNAYYRFVLRVCELVLSSLVPGPGGGRMFKDFRDDDDRMNQVFEKFLFNFLRIEQKRMPVSRSQLSWNAVGVTPNAESLVPGMHTDVTLSSERRTVIIDAKYKKAPLAEFYGARRFHSENLYQLYSYLRACRREKGPAHKVSGALVYPAGAAYFDERVMLEDFPVRLVTIDLAAPWSEIHGAVLSLAA